jgi:hypothetical protein
MNKVAERNLFVNTSTVIDGDGRNVTINLPQGYADCANNQEMKLSLTSFLMEKKFYNINDTNRRFFITAFDTSAGTFNLQSRAIELDQGNYRSFGGRQYWSDATTPYYGYDERGLGYNLKTKILEALGFRWLGNPTSGNPRYEQIGSAQDLLTGTPATTTGLEDDLVVVNFQSNTQTYSVIVDMTSASFTALAPNPTLFPGTPTTATFQIDFFSFELPSYQRIPGNIVDVILGANNGWQFVDTHEIVGGCSVQSNLVTTAASAADLSDTSGTIKKLFVPTRTAGSLQTQTFIGTFQAALRTIEAIYVRTNLPSSNFQTASFDTGGQLYPYVVKSDILAKIPMPNPMGQYSVELKPTPQNAGPEFNANYDYQLPWEYISFVDSGDIFSAMLNVKHVAQINLRLTDDKGRILPFESAEQQSCNELYFTATLKVTVYQQASQAIY